MGLTVFGSKRSLAETARFHRRVLYGFAVLLSATIGGAAALFIGSSLNRFFEAKEDALIRNQELAQAEVVRLSSRLMSMVDLYERGWAFHQQESVPIDRYQTMLRQQDGSMATGEDLTATPFRLEATARGIENSERLGTMLHILRRVSAAPVFDAASGITVSGFVYDSDRSLVAAAPITAPFLTSAESNESPRAFIHNHVDPVEDALSSLTAPQLLAKRPLWLPLEDNVRQRAIAEIVVPIFHDRTRVVTIVGRIPPDQFLRYFLQAERPRGFFVLGGKDLLPLGTGPASAKDSALLATVRANASRLRETTRTRPMIRDGLTFIMAQRIQGPGWISVYAFDWKDIVAGMLGEIAAATLLCIGALALLWAGVAYFDRRVAQPFERDAKRLVEEEEFNRSIIDTAPVGIAVFDAGRRAVVLENAVAVHLLGQAGSSGNVDFYEAAVRARANASLSSADPSNSGHTFFEMPWKTGTRDAYIGVASSTTRFRGRDAVLFGLIEVTERKTAEAMLIEARRAADRANSDKSMFLAIMSHEIRTPLHGATGHLELLSNTPLDDEQSERVGLIRRSFDSLLALINDLLDATRIEAHALTINPQPIYVNRVAEHCAQHFAPTILSRNVSLHCYTDPELDRLLDGDDHRLMQILQNLVSNAAKFTQHGSIAISTKLLRMQDGNAWVRIEVADTGIGIPSALQAMVFKPLTQADASISRRFGGTGLGLFLCRNLAELMGGTVTLQSEPNVGSTFGIELPLHVHEEPNESPPPLQGVSVAIATEDRQLSDMWSRRLESWGASVQPTGSGAPPDLLVVTPTDAQGVASSESTGSTDRRALRGVIQATPAGPLTPAKNGDTVTVSLYSSEALLAALLDVLELRPATATSSVPQAEHVEPLDILIAEDDPVNRVLIEHQLKTLGYTSVRSAKDGREALDLWTVREPDALVTDIGMPYLDGIGLLAEIRKRNPNAFVVATTAAGSSDINPETAARFSQVLRKPVLLASLRDALAKAATARHAAEPPPEERAQGAMPADNQLDAALREAFAQSWPGERDAIREALDQRDRDRSRRRLHRLQGALLAMGLDSQAAQCLTLQTQCVEGNWSQVNEQFEELTKALDKLASHTSAGAGG